MQLELGNTKIVQTKEGIIFEYQYTKMPRCLRNQFLADVGGRGRIDGVRKLVVMRKSRYARAFKMSSTPEYPSSQNSTFTSLSFSSKSPFKDRHSSRPSLGYPASEHSSPKSFLQNSFSRPSFFPHPRNTPDNHQNIYSDRLLTLQCLIPNGAKL